jgi:recombination protein RecR
LTYYLLHVPQTELDEFAKSLANLKKDTVLCSICKNVSVTDPCPICADSQRDTSTIMIVEQPLDILVFERTGRFNGMYHVLHGAISPLENIGPDELFIFDFLKRIQNADAETKEVIIATNPTMEGDATAMYLSKKIKELGLNGEGMKNHGLRPEVSSRQEKIIANPRTEVHGFRNRNAIKVSRLGMGVPTGADLEYADEVTLREAIEGRRTI